MSNAFKRAVRARMAKTGERYTTARMHVKAQLLRAQEHAREREREESESIEQQRERDE